MGLLLSYYRIISKEKLRGFLSKAIAGCKVARYKRQEAKGCVQDELSTYKCCFLTLALIVGRL